MSEQPKPTNTFADNYSWLDKALHYFAFKTRAWQLKMADNESFDHQDDLAKIAIAQPTFITALPRAGTTILLEVLAKTGLYAHHRYQDMPFVLTPLMWAKFTRFFGQDGQLRERAHGDGIQINDKSPEAFEEILWQCYWPTAKTATELPLMSSTQRADFDGFFIDHMKKLIYRERQKGQAQVQRYLSKNNLNIIRLGYIQRLLPDSRVVLPFRQPLQHAQSLLRQHQNFLQLQQGNAFASDYMAAIGHFDFGLNFKPINFNDWLASNHYQPDSLAFWLSYWLHCYQYLLAYVMAQPASAAGQNCVLLSFENLCQQPALGLTQLAGFLQIPAPLLVAQATEINVAKAHVIDTSAIDGQLLSQVEDLYQRLQAAALNGLPQ